MKYEDPTEKRYAPQISQGFVMSRGFRTCLVCISLFQRGITYEVPVDFVKGTSNFSRFSSFSQIQVLVRVIFHPNLVFSDRGSGHACFEFRKYSVVGLKGCKPTAILNKNGAANNLSKTSINSRLKEVHGKIEKTFTEDEVLGSDVDRITSILKEKNPLIPMEELLESCGISFTPVIVEKVVSRCLRVSHLALRFFNWVKLQPSYRHTSDTYNAMIYIAGEEKDFSCVKRLLEDMDKESCPKTVKTWTILISKYGKANLVAKALKAFEEMENSGNRPDKTAYDSIISILCKARKIDLANKLYERMLSENLIPDFPTYRLLMKCWCEQGNLLRTRALGDEMLTFAHLSEQEVYSCLLKCYCIAGRIEEALELIHEIKERNLLPEPEIFHMLIKGLCRNGKMDDAMQLVNVMKMQNCTPDENVYGILVDGYLKRGQLEKAFETMHIMKELGYIPTVSSYTALVQHLFRENRYKEAIKLFEEMQECGREPDVVMITAMIAGEVSQGHISEAWELFNAMKSKGLNPTWKTYSIFIKELCKAGRSEEACKLLLEMKDRSINPGARIFQNVVQSLENEGKRDKVVEVTRVKKSFNLVQVEKEAETRINQTDVPHFNLDCAIDEDNEKLLKDGHAVLLKNRPKQMQSDSNVEARCILERDYADYDFQKIRGILLNNKNQHSLEEALQESEVTFTPSLVIAVLHSCQKHGYVALRFFSWVGQQSGYCHTTDTYNMAIKITGSAKDFRYMRGLLAYMRSEGCPITANTWTIIITQYGRAGLTNAALLKFKEMKDDNCKPNASTYKYLIMFLCVKKGRNIQAAMQVFQEMLHAGFMPDKSLSGVFLTSLCEEGKLIDARKCADDLQRRGCLTSQIIYSILVKSFSRVGKMSEALELVDKMKNWGCVIDEYVYGSLLPGLLRTGQVSKALEMLDSMRDVGYLPTVHIYTALIIHFFRENKSKQALWFLEEMKKAGCEPTVVTYTALIRGYMNEGLMSNAWNTFNLMKEKGPAPDFETYSTFIHCLCRAGKSKMALELLYEMMEIGIHPSAVNFRTVFFGFNREGKRQEAVRVLRAKWALSRRRKAYILPKYASLQPTPFPQYL